MKNRVTPTAHERVMREEDIIVSKTDAKGRITYANRIFMEFAGYRESERTFFLWEGVTNYLTEAAVDAALCPG